jgi:endonuclease/exonuclease/phosphatase family metal-dependent hydrolase
MKELIIGTWNVSECVGTVWDVRQGISVDPAPISIFSAVQQIARKINESRADIVCLQEYPITQNGNDAITEFILSHTALPYYYGIDTYPSFLMQNGRIGIAIFSRVPLQNIEYHPFKNPDIEKISKSGKRYYSFDKGLITTDFTFDETPFTLVTGHAISFSPFDQRAEDYPDSFYAIEERVKALCPKKENVIVMGDFNTEALFEILPSLVHYVRDVLPGATTAQGLMEGEVFEKGRKLDYCLVTPSLEVVKTEKLANFSDHLFCLCYLRKKEQAI